MYTVVLQMFGVDASLYLFAGLSAGDFFCGNDTHTHERRGDHFLGDPVSRERRPDGRLRTGPAQLFHSFQRGHRTPLLETRPARTT